MEGVWGCSKKLFVKDVAKLFFIHANIFHVIVILFENVLCTINIFKPITDHKIKFKINSILSVQSSHILPVINGEANKYFFVLCHIRSTLKKFGVKMKF